MNLSSGALFTKLPPNGNPVGESGKREATISLVGVCDWRLDSESWPRAGNPGRDSRKTDRTEISILAPIP